MRWVLVGVIALAGCTLFFDGKSSECTPTKTDGPTLVDPFSNTCEFFGCRDRCGCENVDLSVPDFAPCSGPCTELAEAACLSTAGCRATYNANATIDEPPAFASCWATSPSGPIEGACAGLDAQTCSEHDDCSGLYDNDKFVACQSEISCSGSAECKPGTHCTVDDGECLPPPNCPPNGACTTVCAGHCVLN